MTRYLLDTNIVIAFLAGDPVITGRIAQAEEVNTPAITVGELYFGAQKSARLSTNVASVEKFVSQITVLSCDIQTARQYGLVKHGLRAKGRPIPDNDMWIAAVALQHDLTLVTRDVHFNEVAGIKREVW